jgi:hypothetical protein
MVGRRLNRTVRRLSRGVPFLLALLDCGGGVAQTSGDGGSSSDGRLASEGGEADAGPGQDGDATAADTTVDESSMEGAIPQGDGADAADATDATIDTGTGGDGPGPVESSTPNDSGWDGPVIASEPGLFYGGCSPIVAGGHVFFCSASAALDGTVYPLPSATMKSVAVTGGTPTPLGTIVTPVRLPYVNTSSAGFFADTTNVYLLDGQTDAGTQVVSAPIAGGSAMIVASYANGYGPWGYDGTHFYGGSGGGYQCTCSGTFDGTVSGCTCTTATGLVALPTDGGALTVVMPRAIAVTEGGPPPYAEMNSLSMGVDPGAGGNVYAQLLAPPAVTGGFTEPLFVTRISKYGATFDVDAGPAGGLPELAPNLSGTTEFVALASDGTNAFGLGFTTSLDAGALQRIPTDGAAAVELATTSYALFGLTIDSGNAYWITATRPTVDSGVGYQTLGGSVMRVATNGGGSPVTIYDGTSSPWGTPTGVALDATYAYITTAQGNLVRLLK